ncbi:hypothetical protein GCM10027079_15400 [Sediminivirga luteola]|uniref:YdhG-like domain-containing protein n=1 Tax=Sediminivirga luteola TaxID=1774748 RepID=A0A8J2TVD6_9MICO|nr:hypothetical protein GCM10011333_02860 [Sediminivirga luteola]
MDEYIEALEGPAQSRIVELRALCQESAPDAAEAIKWGSPAYVHPSGTILFVLNAFKHHANIVFTPSTRETFATELAAFTTGKGSVALPYAEPLPADLLRRMIQYRVREHVDHGVMWR